MISTKERGSCSKTGLRVLVYENRCSGVRVTRLPTFVTLPTISCPGTNGYAVLFHSLRAACRSEWQMPQ